MDTFYLPTQIRTGRGAYESLGEILASCGRRGLLVCGQHAVRSGLVDRARSLAAEHDIELELYVRAGREPDLSMVEEACSLVRDGNCDVIVGLGGGSPMDLAKAVAGLALLEGPPGAYFAGRPVDGPSIPFVAIPTTAGTGAEVTKNAVLIDREAKIKHSIRDDRWFPRWAIVDPELTLDMPPEVTANSGSDALCQAIEAYTSIGATPLTDSLAEQAITLIGRSLSRAYASGEDLRAREDMAYGSLLAGMAMANARLGAVHGMAHPLGVAFELPHGMICGLLLPYTMEYNLPATPKYAHVAELLGISDIDASDMKLRHAAVEHVWQLLRDIGIPEHLGPLGVRDDDLDAIVEASLPSGSLKHNPRPLDGQDVRRILESAL
ncbi:MAG: iron-containing alcohol dehydrogenase family protein [Anaerolineae bacterium]